MKNKILCPNHSYDKILIAYDTDKFLGPCRFWVHCGDKKCSRWVQVDINAQGGVITTLMPENYHFDFVAQPSLVEGS